MIKDWVRYPMGAFVQLRQGGELIGARVEWHPVQAATGKHGCFHAISLMDAVPKVEDVA
jgi:hypothetical protein